MSWLSKGAKNLVPTLQTGGLNLIPGGESFFKGLFGAPGPSNPYGAPNPTFLMDPARYDYMKKAGENPYIANLPGSAKTISSPYITNLPSQTKTFASTYKPPVGTSDAMFKDYINSVSAPSSVDEVQRNIENEQVQQMLREIGRGTEQSVASQKLDYQDRGLGGPGQMSDIEAVALAQTRGQGEELAAQTRLEALKAEIERQKAKELATQEAYKARYGVGAEADTQARQIAAAGAVSDVEGHNQLLGKQAELGLTEATQNAAMQNELLKEQANLSTTDLNRQAQMDQARAALISGDYRTYAQIMADLYSGGEKNRVEGRIPSLAERTSINLGFKV